MSFTFELLQTEALNLPIAERARLVEKLIVSLDTEPDVEAAWGKSASPTYAGRQQSFPWLCTRWRRSQRHAAFLTTLMRKVCS